MYKWFFFIAIIILVSCNSRDTVFSDSFSVKDNIWHKDSTITFSIPITDTTKTYSVLLHIENTDSYRWANLFLFSTIQFPYNKTIRDTINLIVSNPKGEWTGEGIGGKYKNTFPYKNLIRFPGTGYYTFTFQQAMRCEQTNNSIEGISKIGIDLVAYKNK